MNDTSVATQQLHLERLFERIHFWFHEPDPMAIRATLAVTAALSLDTHPLWLMLVGASSIGKTAIHFPLAQAHPRCFTTSDVTIAGLLSMGKGSKDKGILREVGVKGLWLIKDFSAILGMHDDQRNKLMAAMRDLYDGKWGRQQGTGSDSYTGHLNLIAASTTAVERFHRVNADLGERFIQIRLKRPYKAWRHTKRQRGKGGLLAAELTECAQAVLKGITQPTMSDEWEEVVDICAEFTAHARAATERDKFSHEITSIGQTEGAPRLHNEFAALLLGDAAVHGQEQVDARQMPLLLQVMYDTIPYHRGNVLRVFEVGVPLRRSDLFALSGEKWDYTFAQTIQELFALQLLNRDERSTDHETYLRLSAFAADILGELKAKHIRASGVQEANA